MDDTFWRFQAKLAGKNSSRYKVYSKVEGKGSGDDGLL